MNNFNIDYIKELQKKIQKKVNEKDLLQTQLNSLTKQKNKLKSEIIIKERALEFIKDTALKTQSQLEFHLSDMVSTGLNSVFDEEYNFKVLFEIKRGKTECSLYYEKDGNLIDPISMSGLGAADVASFCLRCAGYSMQPIFRNTLILDEPFKHLSINHHKKAGEIIKLLSDKLNLQMIIVSHSEKLTEYADKIFKVQIKKGISSIK